MVFSPMTWVSTACVALLGSFGMYSSYPGGIEVPPSPEISKVEEPQLQPPSLGLVALALGLFALFVSFCRRRCFGRGQRSQLPAAAASLSEKPAENDHRGNASSPAQQPEGVVVGDGNDEKDVAVGVATPTWSEMAPTQLLSSDSPCLATLTASVDAFINAKGFGEDQPWMLFCKAPYTTLFDQVADAARKGETGDDKLGQNLFSQQKPNFGDTLANYQHKQDVEVGAALFARQLENTGFLLAEDCANFVKKMAKMAELQSLYDSLGEIADERGKPLREDIMASLNLAQRAMGLGRVVTEVFERKGIHHLDELAKKLLFVGLIELQDLGASLLKLHPQSQQSPCREHVFHATMRIAADCYSHLALAVRYEAHYEMTNPSRSQDLQSLSKSHCLLTNGHELCGLAMRYRSFAESPSRMTSSMNGFVQNTEFLYTLDALVAHCMKAPDGRVFSELDTLKKRIELWRMCGGVRWATLDAWGLLDTSRRVPNILLKKAVLENKGDEEIKKTWTDGMRIRQLLLGMLLHPVEDIGYNRYPGFLAPITLAEMLHDIAEAEAIVDQTHTHLNLNAVCGWGTCDAAMMCDILRQYFSVHGDVGNFFEVEGERRMKKATPEQQAEFERRLMEESEEDTSNSSVVLPSYPTNKFTSLIWNVVLEDSSPYLAVLKRLGCALCKATGKDHTLWQPGKKIAEALSLEDPQNGPAHELAALIGYRVPGGTNYVTNDVEVGEGGIQSVGTWSVALCNEAEKKVKMSAGVDSDRNDGDGNNENNIIEYNGEGCGVVQKDGLRRRSYPGEATKELDKEADEVHDVATPMGQARRRTSVP